MLIFFANFHTSRLVCFPVCLCVLGRTLCRGGSQDGARGRQLCHDCEGGEGGAARVEQPGTNGANTGGGILPGKIDSGKIFVRNFGTVFFTRVLRNFSRCF